MTRTTSRPRRLLGALAAVLVAVALLVGGVLLYAGREGDATDVAPGAGPGRVVADRAGVLGEQLRAGNVVLLAASGRLDEARAAGAELAGPPSAELAAAGQAVLVRPSAAAGDGLLALAWRRELRLASPADPGLGAFVDRWLGRGAAG